MDIFSKIARVAKYFVPSSLRPWLRDEYSYGVRSYLNRKEQKRLAEHERAGGDYLTWYADRLDGHIKSTNDIGDPARKRAWLETGKDDLDAAVKCGLKPRHRLHEFGCGELRASLHFIRYLEPGKYSANDASGKSIDRGSGAINQIFGPDLFAQKKPRFFVNRDNTFSWLQGEKPDFIWSGAVLPHMPQHDIECFFDHIKAVMGRESVFLFTWSGADIAQFRPFQLAASDDDKIAMATDFARKSNLLHVIRALKANQGDDNVQVSVKDWFHTSRFYEDIITARGMAFEDISHILPNEHCQSFPMWVRLGRVTLPFTE